MIIIGDNFFDGLQVIFGTMLVWSEVGIVGACMSPGSSGRLLWILAALGFLRNKRVLARLLGSFGGP